MALGIKTESEDMNIMPICKYDARAGRFLRVDRHNDGSGWATDQVDITNGFTAVPDLENIETGWMSFNTGGAPDFRLVALGQDCGPRPSDTHREGFRIIMKLGKESGGDVREFCSAAKATIGALDALHDKYLEGVKSNPGMLPVVKLAAVRPIQTNGPNGTKTTNYAPEFSIVKWIPRPKDLVFTPKTKASGQPRQNGQAAVPPATGSTRAAPPSQQPEPPPWEPSADEQDFG